MGYCASMRSTPVPKRPRAVVVLRAAVTRTGELGLMKMSAVLHSTSGDDTGWGLSDSAVPWHPAPYTYNR